MNHELEQLSPAGMQRRDRMLADLKGHMRTLHHRRRVRRSVVVAGSMTLFVGSMLTSVWLLSKDRGAQLVNPVVTNDADTNKTATSPPAFTLEVVQTDPGIVERWRAQPNPQWVLASDDELLESLAAANKQTGLIRSGGRVWLTNDVATETTPPTSDSSSGGNPSPSVARAKSKPSPRG